MLDKQKWPKNFNSCHIPGVFNTRGYPKCQFLTGIWKVCDLMVCKKTFLLHNVLKLVEIINTHLSMIRLTQSLSLDGEEYSCGQKCMHSQNHLGVTPPDIRNSNAIDVELKYHCDPYKSLKNQNDSFIIIGQLLSKQHLINPSQINSNQCNKLKIVTLGTALHAKLLTI